VWSQSQVPLLFVTLPHEIRIYNTYHPPTIQLDEVFDEKPRLLKKLEGLTDELTARQKINTQLLENNHYQRIYLETGAFWNTTDGRQIKYKTRADHKLLAGMEHMRRLLTQSGLSNQQAYALLGRSIFIRYLEDRGVLDFAWIEKLSNGQATCYQDVLPNHALTYHLFEKLSHQFNGDLFPIEPLEKENVTEKHLEILQRFLSRTNLETGQLSFWSFNFEYIPIELISNIYDTFLEEQRSSGTYYTPLILADFLLEETLGADIIQADMTILDPACGSGIFLVGAYRRLIQAWREQHGKPSPEALIKILQHSLFGIDKKTEAVRIAAFSLYLEILNHLSNTQIKETSFKFPPLQGKNLFTYDFFQAEVDQLFSKHKFNRIIGNMPWGRSTLTTYAEKWLEENKHIVGGKQAAPAFMLRIPEFCHPDGEIALLAPTKSTILVNSETHQTFRDNFFSSYHVRAVVNFSALVYELFSKAISPAVAVFYTPNPPDNSNKLIYAVPKPSSLSKYGKAIILDSTEIKFLDRQELLTNPHLWKIALWGNVRDAVLIEQLMEFPTLAQKKDKFDWKIKEGFIAQYKGSDENEAVWLQEMPLVETTQFTSYFVKPSSSVKDKIFHRHRVQEIYQAPLTLIHRSKCQSSYLAEGHVAYKNKITGVVGHKEQESILKWLVACVNSSLTLYYYFLTSTSWAVERGTIIHKEYTTLPFLIPDENNPKFQKLLNHFNQLTNLLKQDTLFFNAEKEQKQADHEAAINQLVFELYNLHPIEQQLVKDTLEYSLEFFNWAKRKNRKPQGAKPVQPPEVPMLKKYAQVFIQAATSFLQIKEQSLKATIYKNGAPLTIITFEFIPLTSAEAQSIDVIDKAKPMQNKLKQLDNLLLKQKTPSMYIRRHVRIYDGEQVSLVRPSEQRFWTQSQARTDADSFLAELFS
jgi:type I restriction-modification system DNA methylase subunit